MEKKWILAQLNTEIESRIGRGPTQEAFISKKEFKDFFLSDMIQEFNNLGNLRLEKVFHPQDLPRILYVDPANCIAKLTMIAYSKGGPEGGNRFFDTFKEEEMQNDYCMDKIFEFWDHEGPIFKVESDDEKVLKAIEEYGLAAFGGLVSIENKTVKEIKMIHLCCASQLLRNIPKCLDICHVDGCDMRSLHCSNRDYPPMSRCTKCQYWFANLEKRNAI